MQTLELVGYTADLTHLVLSAPDGERFRVKLTAPLVRTLAELIDVGALDEQLELLRGVLGIDAPVVEPQSVSVDGPSPAAAMLTAGTIGPRSETRAPGEGAVSRLSPGEIQRLLRSGRTAQSVAEQAGTSLSWVTRWEAPIRAERQKVIASVRGGRQERDGFGLSRDLIGDAVRSNLMARDIEPDGDDVEWTAARPAGRPYWTVTLKFVEGTRPQRATWRYDIGTGQAEPRDDLAVDLGWSHPVTHPTPGRRHAGAAPGSPDGPPPPPRRAAPPPPAARRPGTWAPPEPPRPRRRR